MIIIFPLLSVRDEEMGAVGAEPGSDEVRKSEVRADGKVEEGLDGAAAFPGSEKEPRSHHDEQGVEGGQEGQGGPEGGGGVDQAGPGQA